MSLTQKWAVVKEDWHYRRVYVPFPGGAYTASQEAAQKRAEDLQAQTHTKDHHHKVSFSAEIFDPDSGNDYG